MLQAIVRYDDVRAVFNEHAGCPRTICVDDDGAPGPHRDQHRFVTGDRRVGFRIDAH